jgi:hypothetical protein
MFTFERTTDWPLIKAISTQGFVWARIKDDFAGNPENWEPSEDPSIGYVLVKEDGEVLGLWICAAESPVHYVVHTRLLPIAYGERSRRAARAFLDWLWTNGKCQRLTMNICVTNRIAIRMAKELGFEEFGVNKRSFMKCGTLRDQMLLGLSRPEGM